MSDRWGIGPLQIIGHNVVYEQSYLIIEGQKIAQICTKEQLLGDMELVQIPTAVQLIPGMIDQHIHGIVGADVMDATYEGLETVSRALAKHGVTSFLATTMTAAPQQIQGAIANAATTKNTGAKLIGIHVEGPFINPIQKGAQAEQFICKPSIAAFQSLVGSYEQQIKLITISPECDENNELLHYLNSTDIKKSVGHSDATYQQMQQTLQHKLIDSATHFCNGMRGIHHREPGLQVALLQSDCFIELIADGIHVDAAMVRFIFDYVGEDRLILISDSMRAADLSDGIYDLGGQQVRVENGLCRLLDGDSIAGSTLNLHRAKANMKNWLQLSDLTLAKLTALNSAKLLQIDDYKGSISIGKDADFYIIDAYDEVLLTVSEGKIIYQK